MNKWWIMWWFALEKGHFYIFAHLFWHKCSLKIHEIQEIYDMDNLQFVLTSEEKSLQNSSVNADTLIWDTSSVLYERKLPFGWALHHFVWSHKHKHICYIRNGVREKLIDVPSFLPWEQESVVFALWISDGVYDPRHPDKLSQLPTLKRLFTQRM